MRSCIRGRSFSPARRWSSAARGTCCTVKFSIVTSTAVARYGSGRTSGASVEDAIDDIGHMPLPPYIKRDDTTGDRDRYQTVYARERGSVAAPTAGLHFTPELLDAWTSGASSARRLRCMSATERFSLSASIRSKRTRSMRSASRSARRRPTRSTAPNARSAAWSRSARPRRAHWRQRAGRDAAIITPQSGWSDLFIYPGFTFGIVDALMTNFHLPESSLLMLVVRVRRPRCRARRVSRGGRREIPVLQLRRRHADSLNWQIGRLAD